MVAKIPISPCNVRAARMLCARRMRRAHTVHTRPHSVNSVTENRPLLSLQGASGQQLVKLWSMSRSRPPHDRAMHGTT